MMDNKINIEILDLPDNKKINLYKERINQLETENEMLDKACDQSMALNKKYNNVEVENQRFKEGIERLIIEYEQMNAVGKNALIVSIYRIFINELKELED